MISSSLKAAIENAKTKYNDLKNRTGDDFKLKATPARDAAGDVRDKLAGLQSIPLILAKYYIALQQANDRVIDRLKPAGQTYTEADTIAVKQALDEFQAAAQQLDEMEAVFSSAGTAEPLFSEQVRQRVGGTAAVLFVSGAIFAAFGTGKDLPSLTTVAYWCACGSFALAAIWLFAYFTGRQPSVPFIGAAKTGPGLQYLVFGGMALLVLGLLAAGILTGKLMGTLASIPGARGLITFLVALGTIAIAVILTLASVIMEVSDIDALKERLAKGKEILTVLVGVLGTIVGFYFASNPEGSAAGKMNVAIVECAKKRESWCGILCSREGHRWRITL